MLQMGTSSLCVAPKLPLLGFLLNFHKKMVVRLRASSHTLNLLGLALHSISVLVLLL